MKYLHDNGFRILPMIDLRYSDNTNSLYLVNNPNWPSLYKVSLSGSCTRTTASSILFLIFTIN
jgi:hypothetical protein